MRLDGLLLAVSGMSPQIVTETLYGIYQEGGPLPERILLVTSASGRQAARSLVGLDGKVADFCRDYNLPLISFSEQDICVITAPDGNPLPDIRTVAENNAAADFIVNLVRDLTRQEGSPVHVSLAGGRKTMAFYVGYALSLFGREQDRLSHVLVSEGYEGRPDFYYPSPVYREIAVSSSKVLDASKARIELADIPFLRLRPLLPENTLNESLSFSETVAESQITSRTGVIEIEPDEGRLKLDGRTIKVTTFQACYYAWLLYLQCRDGVGPVVGTIEDGKAIERGKSFLSFCREIAEDLDAPSLRGASPMIDDGWLRNQRTSINKALSRGLGGILAQGYQVTSTGRHGRKVQCVHLEGYRIVVIGPKTVEFFLNE